MDDIGIVSLQAEFWTTQIDCIWQGIRYFLKSTRSRYSQQSPQPAGTCEIVHAQEKCNECRQNVGEDVDSQKLRVIIK